MTFGQFLLLYLLVGAGVAFAHHAAAPAGPVRLALALAFWPLYLPILLSRLNPEAPMANMDEASPRDDLARTIAQVDGELAEALRSLDGWAEGVLTAEKDRLRELRSAWLHQAERIREMDRLLERADLPAQGPIDALNSERLRSSRQAVEQNLRRLRQVRERTHRSLLETLAWVRELVSMIHLARFTGAPASRAEELVVQIATAVEGVSEVAGWADEGP